MKEATRIGICVVTTSFTEGIIDWINVLASKYEVHLIYIMYPASERDIERISGSCQLHAIGYPYRTHSLAEAGVFQWMGFIPLFINMLVQIRKVMKNHKIGLVHAFWAIPSGFLAAVCCRTVPLVTTLRGSDILVFGKVLIFKCPIRYALRRSTNIIALSQDLRREAVRLGARNNKMHVMPEGVDLSKFKPMNRHAARASLNLPEKFLVLFAGNLIGIKGVDKLIRVCGRLSRDFDLHLIVAGDGPERAKLDNLSRGLGFNNILFLGRVPNEDMPLYMAASNVLVLYSQSEGLPHCVQEAMACGIPVVASNVGGLPELITNGVNGYLANDEAEMEEYLRKLMSSPELTSEMGANALEFAKQNLSFARAAEQIEELYARVLKE